MDDTEAGHRNLLEFAREDARWQSSHTVLDADGLLAFARTSGFRCSTTQVLPSHGIAGVYWVGTVTAARGKRLAEACTAAVTNRAFDQGARSVQRHASPMGEPTYLRMGYEELYRSALFRRARAGVNVARRGLRPRGREDEPHLTRRQVPR